MRKLGPIAATAVALLWTAGEAHAADSYSYESLSAPQAVPRACAKAVPPGSAGVAHASWTAPADGYFNARLSGGRGGDWDLAVFERGSSAPSAVSTAFGSREQATLWVEAGDRFEIQACRRFAGPKRVGLSLDLLEMELPTPGDETFTLEEVFIDDVGEDLERLEELGLDVTHDVTETTATVATYSEAERATLAGAGFSFRTIDEDLAATSIASRRAEARVSPSSPLTRRLPSGRTSYRTYADYTDEMKALAETYPGHVKPLIIGRTFEDRTIQGLEIAGGVDSTTDGRPVYLNMGAHHAREWPSAEFPMEFAITLAEGYGTNQRITDLLNEIRIVIIPVVNVDGFIASRSFGTSPLDDNQIATLPLAATNTGAYIRKNCRPTGPGDALLPCALRTGSGVDPNRNYGAYWGGEGASTDPTSQGYRGTGPFSEPETQAMQAFMSTRNPVLNITNHTFTDEGEWLRQPGFEFDPITDPDNDGIHDVPDGAVHKEIGDAMADATGWASNKSTILGSITGATEDWNYYVQSAYGFTPEGRGPNFHGTYANAVVTEYDGDAGHPGEGVKEAFLRAGEIVADEAVHSVISGPAPPGATLKLMRDYDTPTFVDGLTVDDHLEVTLEVPAGGSYEWHVGPSSRPLEEGEAYTMTCTRSEPGAATFETEVVVDRGEVATVDWVAGDACGDGYSEPPPPADGPKCGGELATIIGTGKRDTLRGTRADDVIVARGGKDVINGRGGDDIVCSGGGDDSVRLGKGDDTARGGSGRDLIRGGGGNDTLNGGPHADVLRGAAGTDSCNPGKSNRDKLRGCEN